MQAPHASGRALEDRAQLRPGQAVTRPPAMQGACTVGSSVTACPGSGVAKPVRPAAVGLERATQLLSQGRVSLLGQILSSSNATFLTRVDDGDLQALAIYKPRRGERPLWDFPRGTLCLREIAAYVVSRALGWPRIPPTILRDGPYGPGAPGPARARVGGWHPGCPVLLMGRSGSGPTSWAAREAVRRRR